MDIFEYIDVNGNSPFNTWLCGLKDLRTQAKIDTRIDRASLGNIGDTKSVGEGVQEMRISYGKGYRVYYGHIDVDTIIVLLCGGDKSSQTKDIKKAKQYWLELKTELKHEQETKESQREFIREIE